MDKGNVIRTYIEREMPGYSVTMLPARGVRPFGFLMERDGYQYTVEFEEDFLNQHDGAEIGKILADWQVIESVCQGEGLRYVVTPRGLRLDSSN